MRGKLQLWLAALLLVALAVALRVPSFPRHIWNLDEANTIVFAQQIHDGDVLYRDVIDTRSPLMLYLLAAELAVAGDWNITSFHVLQAILLGLTAVLLWRLAAQFGRPGAGAWAAAAFTVVSVMFFEPLDTFTTHTEWFLIFFSALGFWRLARAWRRPGAAGGAWAGVCFGLSYLAKQPGLLDGITAVTWVTLFLLFDPADRRPRLRLLLGLVAAFTLTALAPLIYFWSQGALREYQFYVWTYSTRYYLPEISRQQQLLAMRLPLLFASNNVPGFAIAAAIGLAASLWGLVRSARARLHGQELPLLAVGWLLGGVIATAVGGREFDHYSIPAIPGVCLLAGCALDYVWRRGRAAGGRWRLLAGVAVTLPFAVISVPLYQRLAHLDLTPGPEKVVGEWIRKNTTPADRIFVWGFYPEVNYHARRFNSSRFPSANFLTGLIPWTNLDPDRDTSYAVVPGAWDQFWEDMERRPPAVFVDTVINRGYAKYPLAQRARLWAYLQAHYLEIESDAVRPRGFRLYRRVGPTLAGPAAPTLDARLALQQEFKGVPYPDTLKVALPAGTTAGEFLVNGQSIGAVYYGDGGPHQLTFTYRPEIHGRKAVIAVLARRHDGTIAIGPDYPIDEHQLVRRPVIECGPVAIPALESQCLVGPIMWLADRKAFSAHAPARLVFNRPRALQRITFEFGIFDGAFAPDAAIPTDGVELQVSFKPDEGPPRRLLTRAINPRFVAADRGPQRVTVDLPKDESGSLLLVLTTGAQSNGNSDWSYFSAIHGDAVPLTLEYAGTLILPADYEAPFGMAPVVEAAQPLITIHAPSSVEFDLHPDMRAVSGEFALARSSWDNPAGQTAGLDFIVEQIGTDGQVTELWRQALDPAHHNEDRGVHSFRCSLPIAATGRVRFRAAPSHPPNNAFGYACWGHLVAHSEP